MAETYEQGKRLDLVRKSLNMSQIKFSKRIGISQGYYSQVIKGRRNISYKILNAITIQFPEFNPSWILTGIGEMLKQEHFLVNEVETKYQVKPIPIQDLADIILSLQQENKAIKTRIDRIEKHLDLDE